MEIATAVAFTTSQPAEVTSVLQTSQADFALGVIFTEQGKICQVRGAYSTALGEQVLLPIQKTIIQTSDEYEWVD